MVPASRRYQILQHALAFEAAQFSVASSSRLNCWSPRIAAPVSFFEIGRQVCDMPRYSRAASFQPARLDRRSG